MKVGIIKSLLVLIFCGFPALNTYASTSLFSDYGQIQNVQNYSTNPFWTPNAPYNQRVVPQPVYVQGADLNTDDCIKVVQSLVSVQCMARDNCKNTSLSDIRPVVMVQLSNLPGHNYVSACSGYIDGIYESYVQQYGNNIPNKNVPFPAATTPNPTINNSAPQIQNPFKVQPTKWQLEMQERSQELKRLQEENGAGSENLSATDFPATIDDLSFEARMELKTEGYEPYKDKDSYIIPQINQGKGKTTTNSNTNNTNNTNNNSTTTVSGNMCPPTKHNLKASTSLFKEIDVHTPQVAQQILQELIKCSDTPTAVATTNYTTRNDQDYVIVKSADGLSMIGEFEFDDVTDEDKWYANHTDQFFCETFFALAMVAGATNCVAASKYKSGTCNRNGIDQNRFKVLLQKYKSIIGTDAGFDASIEGNTLKYIITR